MLKRKMTRRAAIGMPVRVPYNILPHLAFRTVAIVRDSELSIASTNLR